MSLLLSYAITQVFEPLDGFVRAVIEGCQASAESSDITVVDDVVHGVHLATVTKRGGSMAPFVNTAAARCSSTGGKDLVSLPHSAVPWLEMVTL